jgi:hypothetical protein
MLMKTSVINGTSLARCAPIRANGLLPILRSLRDELGDYRDEKRRTRPDVYGPLALVNPANGQGQ